MYAKKNPSVKITLALSALLILAALTAVAKAEVRCGDVITSNATLDRDLHCGCDPALTVIGPAHLTMRGFTVTCIDGKSKDGIWLKGKNGKIQQGTITGCGKGILVAGDGGHYVHHVNTTANATHGIAIESADNKVKHNTSSGNFGNGIWLSDAASNNVVSKNTTNDNGASGIRLATGSGSNQIDTGDLGILIEDDASSIEDDASSNDITKNEACGNSIFDMMDENAACGGNLFSNNEFGTQSDPCNLVVSQDGTYDPVLHWEFEGSGESILDSSGYGNDAPIQEGQLILDGERGQVLYLNGSHSRITSTINGLNVEFPFSVTFWIKPAQLENYNQHIGPGWGQFKFFSNADGGIHVGIAEAEKFKPSHLNETLNLDEWQLVTYTYAAGEARFYRNGRLIYGASGISQPQPWDNFELFKINGLLDDLRVYNRALSSEEVGELYGGQSSTNEFVLHWEFEGSGETTIIDSSGNGYDAPIKEGEYVTDVERGQVLYLPSGNRAIETSDNINCLNVSQPFSVTFWLKPEQLEAYTQRVGPAWGQFLFQAADTGTIQVGIDTADRFSGSTLRQTLEQNEWQLLAYIYDSGKARFYRNGRIIGEKSSGIPSPQLWGHFKLYRMHGWVDDVRVYNRALTSAEVRELYGGDIQPGGPYHLDDEVYEVIEIWSADVYPGDNTYGQPYDPNDRAGYNIMKHRELVTVHDGHYYILVIHDGRPRVVKIPMDRVGEIPEAEIPKAYIEASDYRARADSHHYFTMEVDKTGQLHIVGDMHNYPRYDGPEDHLPERLRGQHCLYWRTTVAGDIDSFVFMGNSEETAPKGIGYTYPHFFKDNEGELYLMNRLDVDHQKSGQNKKGVGVTRYDTVSQSWVALGEFPHDSALAELVFWEKFSEPGASDGYTKVWSYMTFDSQNHLHIAAPLLDDGETDYKALAKANNSPDSMDHWATDVVYIKSEDGGDTFHKADGTPVNLPARVLAEGDGKQGDIVYDANPNGPDEYILGTSNFIVTDHEDHPVVGFKRTRLVEGLDKVTMLVWHDGETWQKHDELGEDKSLVLPMRAIYSDHRGVITFLSGTSKMWRFWKPDGVMREYPLAPAPFAFNPNYARSTGDLLGYSYDEPSGGEVNGVFRVFHIKVTRPEP